MTECTVADVSAIKMNWSVECCRDWLTNNGDVGTWAKRRGILADVLAPYDDRCYFEFALTFDKQSPNFTVEYGNRSEAPRCETFEYIYGDSFEEALAYYQRKLRKYDIVTLYDDNGTEYAE